AKFANPKVEDVDRVFVVSFYRMDDQLSIHEPPQRNMGIMTGKFLEKGVHMNQKTGQLFTPEVLSCLAPARQSRAELVQAIVTAAKASGGAFWVRSLDEYLFELFC
ncbi:unnamed protein product, partial [Prorocentrum cordatum]